MLEGMRGLLDVDQLTCTGKTLGENIAGAKIHNTDVIHTPDNPMQSEGGLIVLRGNLAPDGAVIKSTAADPKLLKHAGRAMVFDDYNDMAARLDALRFLVRAARWNAVGGAVGAHGGRGLVLQI